MKPALIIAAVFLAGCKEDLVQAPDPVSLTSDALSHYCQMSVAEHDGPKGQVHLEGFAQPLFFGQVRDLLAYLKMPERDAAIVAVYVSDTDAAQSWADMGADNWIRAETAYFVVGAGVAGGMGAPEVVPFSVADAASAFAERYGGKVMTLDTIPDNVVLGPVDLDQLLEVPL